MGAYRRITNTDDEQQGEEKQPVQHRTRPAYVPPEDRVLNLIDVEGGSVWQGEIVEHTGWSASKTSRILSEMEDRHAIDRYQFGRRKLVCHPEHEPAYPVNSLRAKEPASPLP